MNMSPTVASLLWLGLCLAQIAAAGAQSLPSMASCPSSSSEQKGTSMAGTPKPFIRAEPGSVVPREAHVRFCCRSTWRSGSFQLWKDGGCSFQINASREQAEGCFPKSVAAAGNYSCRYSRGLHWSELSAPLQLLVTGHFSKPSLRGAPSTVVSAGDTVTLLCQASPTYHNPKMTFFLLKAGVPHPVQRLSPEGDVANFTLPSVKAEDAGSYSCICSVGERSSSPSDALHLEVTGGKDAHPPKPGSDTIVIVTASCVSVFLFLLLFLVFLCCRHTQHCSLHGKAPRRPSSSPGDPEPLRLTSLPPQEITYAEVSKELQTEPWASESEEPQGVTYTQLSLAALQTGQRAPTATCPEPSVYSTLALH
ncbi:killer cell immunoglobulin-like receptor 3DS1 [Monodelphis domestica]|uniref:killer cell immunoglobulin-like receptor 3DS1 n=1 Tax=Monodelphis domestica TaxID=13616 RepID=UPI0024E271D5|nr:killer cell immunoglobulin-like receptor 3DS1 [Monodelphis domestica]